MDHDLVHVGDHEKGRIEQGFAVLEELLVGVGDVFALAFVLPGKEAFFPDVGSALAASRFGGAGLEGEGLAGGIGFGRGGMVDEVAEVDEVLLRGGALFEFDLAPFGDEVLGCYGGWR